MKPSIPLAFSLALFAGAAPVVLAPFSTFASELAQAQTAPPAPNFGTGRPLVDVLENMEGLPWSAVRLAAQQQAEATLGPKYRNIPAQTPFYAAFQGTFIPASNDTRLAMFSDDGCNVYLDGVLVLGNLDRGQHLPALDQSLQFIDQELVAGQSYDVRIEYSNTIYGGNTDADGATLFAYTYDVNQDRPYALWRAGNPLRCGGIRWPFAGATIRAGAEGNLSAFLATDYDQRDVTIEGATTSGVYSDPCSYVWEASGGSFKGGKNSGQGVVWIAPTAPGTYTVRLRVDDQNRANQPTYEDGLRDDAARGYNDEPLLFSTSINVLP